MSLTSLIAAAYVEVQRTTGVKPDVRARVNRLLRRPTEPDFRALAHFTPPAGMVYVDAGANRGETIASARMYLPDVPIVAFEPNPILVDLINRKRAGDKAFTLHAAGLGEDEGSFELHVPYYKGVPFDGLSSFMREEAANWLNADRLAGFDPKHQEIRTFTCKVERLDTFNLVPCFIKIDVQGLEPAVIRGGAETIRRYRPAILMENNKPDTDAAQLIAMGYVPHAWRDGRMHAKQTGVLNTFYIHPSTRDMFSDKLFI